MRGKNLTRTRESKRRMREAAIPRNGEDAINGRSLVREDLFEFNSHSKQSSLSDCELHIQENSPLCLCSTQRGSNWVGSGYPLV